MSWPVTESDGRGLHPSTRPATLPVYSLIESKNIRSLSVSHRQGFSSAAELGTYLFGRFTLKKHAGFRVVTAEELPAITGLLEQQYAHYGFRHWTRIGYQQHYFVLEVNSWIVTGPHHLAVHPFT